MAATSACRGVDLRLGLADVLGARAGLRAAGAALGRRALGARALDLQLGVARVEARDDVAGVHAVAFGDAQLEQAAADFRRHLHLGRLDVARHAQRVRRAAARGSRRRRASSSATTVGSRIVVVLMSPSEACRAPRPACGGRTRRPGAARRRPCAALRCASTRWRAKKMRIGGMIVRWVSSGSASRNTPSRCPWTMTSRTATKTAFIMPKRVGVEVRAPDGELAQHDRREPRPGGGFLDDGGDPGVELVLGGAGAVGDGAGAARRRRGTCRAAPRGRGRACCRSGSRASPC